jgi:hypothetical protein
MRKSACRIVRSTAVAAAIAAVALLVPSPAFADQTAGPWERAFDGDDSMCGTTTVVANFLGAGPAAFGKTSSWSGDNCTGFLEDTGTVETTVVLQYLGWDFVWHNCGTVTVGETDAEVVAGVGNTAGCPTTAGISYRSVTTHGGFMNGAYYNRNHFPLISPVQVL